MERDDRYDYEDEDEQYNDYEEHRRADYRQRYREWAAENKSYPF